MLYSLIIPAHHRPEALGRLLASVAREAEDLPAGRFEVVVVVDGEDERVTKEAKSRLGHMPLIILSNTMPKGAAEARNQGAAISNGAILVFLDDDVVLGEGWGKILRQRVRNPHLVTGDVHFGRPDTPGVYPERVVRSREGWPLGAHLMVRRDIFEKMGGFDPRFGELHNEDSEFVLRALHQGFRWEHLADLVVHHAIAWWPSPVAVVRAARRSAVIPILLRQYPEEMRRFPLQRSGPVISPKEFLLLLSFPVSVWPLLLRFLWRNRRHLLRALPYFFAKWPCAVVVFRIHLWRSAWKERVFVV